MTSPSAGEQPDSFHPFSLQGKTAIVTGGAHGIGRAIGGRLAAHGARVLLVDFEAEGLDRTVNEIKGKGGEAVGMIGDVTEEETAVKAVATVMERWGSMDILVNNVGGTIPGRIWDLTPENWDWIMRLNLRPLFLFTRQVAPLMIKARSGRIVCISSGSREGTPWSAYYAGAAPYSTVKAGVHGFIRDMALELGEYGVTINAVAPGPIDTERVGPFFRKLEAEGREHSPLRLTPLKRLGKPDEIANTVAFLASEEAAYITGVTLNVTGGR